MKVDSGMTVLICVFLKMIRVKSPSISWSSMTLTVLWSLEKDTTSRVKNFFAVSDSGRNSSVMGVAESCLISYRLFSHGISNVVHAMIWLATIDMAGDDCSVNGRCEPEASSHSIPESSLSINPDLNGDLYSQRSREGRSKMNFPSESRTSSKSDRCFSWVNEHEIVEIPPALLWRSDRSVSLAQTGEASMRMSKQSIQRIIVFPLVPTA